MSITLWIPSEYYEGVADVARTRDGTGLESLVDGELIRASLSKDGRLPRIEESHVLIEVRYTREARGQPSGWLAASVRNGYAHPLRIHSERLGCYPSEEELSDFIGKARTGYRPISNEPRARQPVFYMK